MQFTRKAASIPPNIRPNTTTIITTCSDCALTCVLKMRKKKWTEIRTGGVWKALLADWGKWRAKRALKGLKERKKKNIFILTTHSSSSQRKRQLILPLHLISIEIQVASSQSYSVFSSQAGKGYGKKLEEINHNNDKLFIHTENQNRNQKDEVYTDR